MRVLGAAGEAAERRRSTAAISDTDVRERARSPSPLLLLPIPFAERGPRSRRSFWFKGISQWWPVLPAASCGRSYLFGLLRGEGNEKRELDPKIFAMSSTSRGSLYMSSRRTRSRHGASARHGHGVHALQGRRLHFAVTPYLTF